jgi:The GLUG motif
MAVKAYPKTIAIILILCCGPTVQAQTFAGGAGEPNDPYQVATAEQLVAIGADLSLLDKSFILVADIDLDPNLPGGQVLTRAPIAPHTGDGYEFKGEPFAGGLDGNGFAVSNLTISGGSFLGLFGSLGPGAEVKDLRIEDANVTSSEDGDYVGSLAGWNDGYLEDCDVSGHFRGGYAVGGLVGCNAASGTIHGCNATGSVAEEEWQYGGTVGGLVGGNSGVIRNSQARADVTAGGGAGGLVGSNDGRILACCARGQVTGYEWLGGLVGGNSGTISSCYAIVDVCSTYWTPYLGALVGGNAPSWDDSGEIANCYAVGTVLNAAFPEDSYHGALVGGLPEMFLPGVVINSFWDMDIGGVPISMGGTGLSTPRMADPDVYSLNGWGGDPNWVLDAGNDYPRLAWEETPGEQIPAPVMDWFEGEGTPEEPYVVATARQLGRIGTASIIWDKAFILAGDVDLAGLDFPRIGYCLGTDFTGTFDGAGHVVSNLAIDTGEFIGISPVGMFGYIGPAGRVQQLIVRDAAIQCDLGPNDTGILGGINAGTISACTVTGTLSGGSYGRSLGGLAGRNTGRIEDCGAEVSVRVGPASDSVGGLVGSNRKGQIDRCCAMGSVSAGDGSRGVGGLVGNYSYGSITRSFATAPVTGDEGIRDLGGLVGRIEYGGTIADCYATGDVRGAAEARYLGGLIGYQDHGGSSDTCYAVGQVCGGEGSKYLGGLIGRFVGGWSDGITTACFWDVQTSGLGTSAGGKGLTTSQLMDLEFLGLNGWGGNPNWVVDAGNDYPRLVWEGTLGAGIPDTSATPSFDGSGTEEDPYVVVTADQFVQIGNSAALWNRCFVLGADLDMTGIAVDPIGVGPGMDFTGVFDGDGYMIRNLTMDSEASTPSALGLFGYVGSSGQIRHVGLEDARIVAGDDVENVGLLGSVNDGTITDCHASGSVIVGDRASATGGLIGYNDGSVTRCLAVTVVNVGEASSYVGGLVGNNCGGVTTCRASGTISSGRDSSGLGGLSGSNLVNRSYIADSYSDATVSGGAQCAMLGGLVGLNLAGQISRSYACGPVVAGEASSDVGGFLGSDSPFFPSELANCYFLSPTDGGGPGNGKGQFLMDAEMTQEASFVDWDFETIWMICEGQGYPHLQWEGIGCGP